MREKAVKLPMDFGEALARLARTPKTAIDAAERKSKENVGDEKPEAVSNRPRVVRPSGRSR